MLKNTKDKEDNIISIEIGLYPGILIGMRTYQWLDSTSYVIYIPFIDFVINISR